MNADLERVIHRHAEKSDRGVHRAESNHRDDVPDRRRSGCGACVGGNTGVQNTLFGVSARDPMTALRAE
jgi:hypothetical protein